MPLFEHLTSKLAKAAKPSPCPRCGEKQSRSRKEVVVTCHSCGYRGSRTEWNFRRFRGAADDGGGADPDHPPANTKIVRRQLEGNTIAWEVPPSGRSTGLLGFAILWTGFMTIWTALALFAGDRSDDPESSLFPLFSLPFWAVGLGMLYYSLRAKHARHLFLIDSTELIMVRSFFNRKNRKTLRRDQLKWVRKKEFYQQNYTPVYGIEIRGEDGKIRFGSTLSEPEKEWLVADMERVLWPERAAMQQAVSGDGATAVQSQPRESFDVVFPPIPMQGSVTGLIIGFIGVGAFLAIGIFLLNDAGLFRWLWLGINSLFAIGMIWGAVHSWRNRHRTFVVQGNRSEIKVKIQRGGNTVRETHLPRRGEITIHSYQTGHVNNEPRLRIELVSEDEVVPIAKFYPKDLATEPILNLKRWL